MNPAVYRTVPPDGMNPQYVCIDHAAMALFHHENLRTLDLSHGEDDLECERCDLLARRRNRDRQFG